MLANILPLRNQAIKLLSHISADHVRYQKGHARNELLTLQASILHMLWKQQDFRMACWCRIRMLCGMHAQLNCRVAWPACTVLPWGKLWMPLLDPLPSRCSPGVLEPGSLDWKLCTTCC